MQGTPLPRLTLARQRSARRIAYWNGALWAIGNGLTSSTLIVYLALKLGVPRAGLGVALIKAAPQLVGLLRLGTPALIPRIGDRKRFCLIGYVLSGLVLFGLPLVASGRVIASKGVLLTALVGLWCVYQLLEYVATVAYWSWLADLVGPRIRGRFLGLRERWMLAGQAAAMLAAGLFVWGWHGLHPQAPSWIGYAIPAGLGAWFLVAAAIPLARMPGLSLQRSAAPGVRLRSLLTPLGDGRFLRLLTFGCWFSFFNGITQAAQYLYPYQILGMSLFVMLALQTGMRCGQWLASPAIGRLADRLGNRPVMVASLPVVASGLLFYALATREQPWWLAAAWTTWIAYAGLNVCLPNLMLKLAPRESNTPYIAAYHALTGLCVAASTVLGGWALDQWLGKSLVLWSGFTATVSYQNVFLFGWLARTAGLILLLRMRDKR